MRLVPLLDVDRQSLTTQLGGQTVVIEVWWQPLSRAWYVSISQADQPVVLGVQLAPWQYLIGSGQGAGQLTGDLIVLAREGYEETAMGGRAWSRTHGLFYFSGPELALIKSRRARN